MKFELPDLPYSFDALEPHIDAKTMQIHHDKHHQAYVNMLNGAVEAAIEHPKTTTTTGVLSLEDMNLEQLLIVSKPNPMDGKGTANYQAAARLKTPLTAIPDDLMMAVRNHGGGHWNHTLFWEIMGPDSGTMSDELSAAIESAFGSIDEMKEAMHKAAMTRFGSGWAWMCSNNGKLSVCSTSNQDNPLMGYSNSCGRPIMGVDVWEHAYYLKYQNLRGDYLNAFFNVVNWSEVSRRYAETLPKEKKESDSSQFVEQ